jgi:hypothetical protein
MLSFMIAIVTLGFIFYQDLRYRSIHWLTVVTLFVALIGFQWPMFYAMDVLYNLGFIAFLLGGLFFYLKIRKQGKINMFKEYFGLGDVLFLIAISPLIAFPWFVYFFTSGTIFTLLCFGIVSLIKRNPFIPYAGYFSLYTSCYLLFSQSAWGNQFLRSYSVFHPQYF